ncbi:hypothetical protein DENIS_3329 [Desulfonema ishimotonii]|uniref:DUF4154 domain-containing protein n=1 Tax=Desulfonema ishimotonii TaxID=45657 RepID=A0A401FZI4_9BACT|nr:YfiR family protein [Desulfonema ishimotonii]GBC62357.1 hypothetical protein DENIS_3329 [Desulfonema ishimotonii]
MYFLKLLVTLAVVVMFPVSASALPENSARPEYEVKAAYLYLFAKFVRWPEASAPENADYLVIGILGDDPFGPYIDAIESSKPVRGKPIRVKRFSEPERVEGCHILYVSPSEKKRVGKILKRTAKSNILTVGDTEGFARQGVIINLINVDNKVRFEINLKAARQAGIRISSQLSKLAERIY